MLVTEVAVTIANGEVWLSIGEALVFGLVCFAVGTWAARTVGLLGSDAPAGETVAVGLSSGLMIVAACWAAVWSGGGSSFTPAAVGFVVSFGIAIVGRARRIPVADPSGSALLAAAERETVSSPNRRSLVLVFLAGAVFVMGVALLYGATLAPSPRDGVQPIEHPDEALYAVLGRDLAATGIESNVSSSGFTDVAGLPPQAWYHWGEIWLAGAAITVFGAAPLAARYFVVLPVMLLAAAALMGTLVRRTSATRSTTSYLFGFLACLFLVPLPFLPGPVLSSWAAGLIFGITLYGLAAVAVLVALYSLFVMGARRPTWALACYVGSAGALILPSHIVIAVLAIVGVGSVFTIRIARSLLATRKLPTISPVWRRTYGALGIVFLATVAWGVVTGHGVAGSERLSTVTAFNQTWRATVAITFLGAGVFLAIPFAWLIDRTKAPVRADVYLGTIAVLFAGAIAWGARLPDFNMFYLLFGGIAVIATPVAAIAAWSVLERLRTAKHRGLTFAFVAMCVIQLEWGALTSVSRLTQYGPLDRDAPLPLGLLAAIRSLPPDSTVAYACLPLGEVTFGEPQLISIDAHTGHHVVPLCFMSDMVSDLRGGKQLRQTPSADWAWAPQRMLYPDAGARPSSAAIAAFLEAHRIEYIYADARHPNVLVADAIPLWTNGNATLLRIP